VNADDEVHLYKEVFEQSKGLVSCVRYKYSTAPYMSAYSVYLEQGEQGEHEYS